MSSSFIHVLSFLFNNFFFLLAAFYLFIYFLNFIYLFIYLFIFGCAGSSVHGLSLVAASGDYSFIMVCRLLIAVVSLVAEHGL